MKRAGAVPRFFTLAMIFFATIASIFCWSHLHLAHYFLFKVKTDQTARIESSSSSPSRVLSHFVWQAPDALTWGALGESPGLGLEPELVVESYKCTKNDGRALEFSEIGSKSIAGGETITIVLARNGCPR